MSETFILGIDPGVSGGLCSIRVRDPGGSAFLIPMPKTERDLWNWATTWPDIYVSAVIEQVQGHIGVNQPGSAMFKFGQNYGSLRMALVAAGIPFEEVPPRTWQKELGISSRKSNETKTEWKNRLKQKAQNLFPRVKVTLATADALLIAEYGRRKYARTAVDQELSKTQEPQS